MRPLLAGLLLTVLATAAGRDARAGMLAACDEPAGFAGPVQVFVLQYGFEPSAATPTRVWSRPRAGCLT